jgi:hypothetical protein
MNFLFKISLVCFIFNTSCSRNDYDIPYSKIDPSQNTVLNIDTSKIAILDVDKWMAKRFSIKKSFNLTNTDIKGVNDIFTKCVLQNNIDTSFFHYKRQYVSFIDKEGHKKVWINCFCWTTNDEYSDWKKSVVMVDDGGSCYFNLIIDLTDNSFSDFEVNATA